MVTPLEVSYTLCPPCRKRKRFEQYEESATVEKIQELVGKGKTSIASACELAGGVVSDHPLPHAAIKAFASLGTDGKHLNNSERDLHRWMKDLYGLRLQPYLITLPLQVDTLRVEEIPTHILLPHEVLHAIATMEHREFFNSIFLGNMNDVSREEFWLHIKSLGPWRGHPVINSGCDLKRLIGVSLHGDGAVMKRDDECFCWSFSSCFGSEGLIKDPLHLKFPIAIVPERFMLTKAASRLKVYISICLFGVNILRG